MRKVDTSRSPKLTLALSLALLFACDRGEVGPSEGATVSPSSPQPAPRSTENAVVRVVGFDDVEPFLAAHRGKGLLLNFWAIWCGPCVAELPELVEVAEAYRAQGGRVVGISYDLMVPDAEREGIEDRMRAFMASKRMDYPVLIYDEDDYDALNERFELFGEVPVTLAVDAQGTIVDRQRGKATRERFDEMMRRALGTQGS